MREYQIPNMDGLKLTVDSNTLSLVFEGPTIAPFGNALAVGFTRESLYTHTPRYPSETPFYTSLEGFTNYAGDGIRVAAAEFGDGVGRVIYLYDARPPFYPTIANIPDPDKRAKEEAVRAEEPYLYGPGGEMLEWQMGGNWGYAWNLDVDDFSEWGTMTMFPYAGESQDQMQERHEGSRKRLEEAFGGFDKVVIAEGPDVIAANFTN